MNSVIAITSEIDDLPYAVEELTAQVREGLSVNSGSIGIVYCDSDVDVAELGRLLHEELNIDIAGLTTTATIERHTGYNDMGIMLAVFSADDVAFSIGCTGEMQGDDFPEVIKQTYNKARARIKDAPKLILTLAPYIADITSENYVEILNDVSDGVPIFGGVATDHYDLKYQKTFHNGEAFSRGLVFILIEGNIKPVFAMKHHFGAKIEKKAIITKSSDNLVNMVGDQTFKDYVSSMVPVPEQHVVIYHFQSTPFVMELPDYTEDEQPVVRALCTIDHETGAGGFLSKMPEGSAIFLNVFTRRDLSESCNSALSLIMDRMAHNKDYKYSMIFISTCNARHLLMGDVKNLESDIVSEKLKQLPAELNAMGFYGFGEMCPTGQMDGGSIKNRFHNISFAVCAI